MKFKTLIAAALLVTGSTAMAEDRDEYCAEVKDAVASAAIAAGDARRFNKGPRAARLEAFAQLVEKHPVGPSQDRVIIIDEVAETIVQRLYVFPWAQTWDGVVGNAQRAAEMAHQECMGFS